MKTPNLFYIFPLLIGAVVAISTQNHRDSKALEITEVDVFADRNWDSGRVTICGFALGMRKENVLAVAKAKNLKIVDPNRRGPCSWGQTSVYGRVNWCDVDTLAGSPTGVALSYNRNAVIDAIHIDPLWPAFPGDPRQHVVTNKFKGRTFQLVNHYSDGLRRQLLGPEDEMEEKNPAEYITERYYKYVKLGVLFQVTHYRQREGERHPPRPVLSSIRLVPPAASTGRE